MLKQIKIIEFLISFQLIIISTMLPIYISIPRNNNIIQIVEFPITWQVPIIIFLTIIFSGKIVYKAFTVYFLIGLFILPIFYDGGSLGYMLTPNFGYLLGIYPLIKTINKLNNKGSFSLKQFFIFSILALTFVHVTGIIFNSIKFLLFNKINFIPYIVGKFTISKIVYELLMLFPILILLKPFKTIKSI